MSSDKQLHAQLARYMDAKAFEAVKVGKEQAEKLKVRREIATKRARTAVRFFLKPDNLSRLTAQASLASTPTPPTLATVDAGKPIDATQTREAELPADDEELAMVLCEADGHDPHELTYHFTEPGVQEPYGDRWTHYAAQAARLRAALNGRAGA